METAGPADKGEGTSRHGNTSDRLELSEQDAIASPSEALYYTQYGIWYPLFRKHAPKSTVLNISSIQPQFIDWMQTETIVLPIGSGPSTLPPKLTSLGSETSTEDTDDEEDLSSVHEVRLDALDAEIRRVLRKYDGGPVFPKLNWSAPLDASFMLAGNNLQCLHPEDVYLLLKSSEFAAADMEQISQMASVSSESASSEPENVQEGDVTLPVDQIPASPHSWHLQLVLKQWFAFNKSYEFRCFVRGNHLVAISQRDMTFYPHLQTEDLLEEIKDKIWDFWRSVLCSTSFPLRDYVFDAYMSKDRSRVWLVDINPWLPRTDPLLFTFEHLECLHKQARARPLPTSDELSDDFVRIQLEPTQAAGGLDECPWDAEDVEFRVLTDERMQTGSATYSANMVPRDLVDFAKGATSTADTPAMSVDQVVNQWNRHVMGQETPDND